MPIVKLIIKLFAWIKAKMLRWVYKIRAKLRMASLRDAIAHADKVKKDTDKKSMVVFNNYSGHYESLTKQQLKKAARLGVVKSSKTQQKKKRRMMDHGRVKQIENRSLYVTR